MTADAQCLEAQQPDWYAPGRLSRVLAQLARRPPLVDDSSCMALRDELRLVACGEGFVLQAGDCAERFAECAPHLIRSKASLLHRLADILEAAAGLPVVRVGRFAGQFAKPRSSPTETLPDGTVLPCYRGDAVNDAAPNLSARWADPQRLLQAYDSAAMGLRALAFDRLLPTPGAYGTSAKIAPAYVSHEALLLDYEKALLRHGDHAGSVYASSAHLVWIGDRTRDADGPHVRFAAALANPVGLKVGPSATPAEVHRVVNRLTVGQPPGRLVIICRIGAYELRRWLPKLLVELRDLTGQVVWMCDPMHGNTIRTKYGQKTRLVPDVIDEVEGFCAILRAYGVHPGGLHLEITPSAVTECIDKRTDIERTAPLSRYETACDPRLNPEQAEHVIRAFLAC
jgi:3-deoxy-7-phosphoheptulonate synthase